MALEEQRRRPRLLGAPKGTPDPLTAGRRALTGLVRAAHTPAAPWTDGADAADPATLRRALSGQARRLTADSDAGRLGQPARVPDLLAQLADWDGTLATFEGVRQRLDALPLAETWDMFAVLYQLLHDVTAAAICIPYSAPNSGATSEEVPDATADA